MIMTYHAQKVRADRMNYMIDNFYSDTVIIEGPSRFEGFTARVYHTGLTLIISDSTGELVTAYMISPKMLMTMYRKVRRIPSNQQIKRITDNYKQYCKYEKARK